MICQLFFQNFLSIIKQLEVVQIFAKQAHISRTTKTPFTFITISVYLLFTNIRLIFPASFLLFLHQTNSRQHKLFLISFSLTQLRIYTPDICLLQIYISLIYILIALLSNCSNVHISFSNSSSFINKTYIIILHDPYSFSFSNLLYTSLSFIFTSFLFSHSLLLYILVINIVYIIII